MRIRMGWSGETEPNRWEKVDIELEEDDLNRILQANDLPDRIQEKLPTRVCFQLMQNELEFLLLNKLRTLGYPPDKVVARQAALERSSDDLVAAIKKQLVAA